MKKTYIIFKEETYNSNVHLACPKLAEKFNAKGSATSLDENEQEVTTTWDYTWKELCEKNKWVPNVKWFYPTQIVQEELLDEEGVGTGVFVDVRKYITETVAAPTEEDANATIDVKVRIKILIVGLPPLSLLNGEIEELKALGTNMNAPYNTIMTTEKEVSELVNNNLSYLKELYLNTVDGDMFNFNVENLPI